METTAKQDIKYVKNLAKEAEGLTETEIKDLETVSEEDMAKFPEGEVIKPIEPAVVPTVEEIEKMEKVEALPEEDKADADFPSNESGSSEGNDSTIVPNEESNESDGSIGDSDTVEDTLDTSELEEIINKFDEIDITVEDVKKQQKESEDFKDAEFSDEVYEDIIKVYKELQETPQADVLDLLSVQSKQEFLVQAGKTGINTNDNSSSKDSFVKYVVMHSWIKVMI